MWSMNKDLFLTQVSVIDTETTNIDPSQAEIIQVAGGIHKNGFWNVNSVLLGSQNPIPPEASATHHISNRMIAHEPRFVHAQQRVLDVMHWDQPWMVAHNSSYDQTVLSNAWISCGEPQRSKQALDKSRWICTYRLARHLLQADFPDMKYSLGYLRYSLDLPVPDDTPAHRADADVLTCALLLEFLVDYAVALGKIDPSVDLGESLNQLCWTNIPVLTWPYGKHRGVLLQDIDTDYYMWALDNMEYLREGSYGFDADLAASVAEVLEKRLDG